MSPEKDYSLYLGGDSNDNDFKIDVNMFLNEKNDNNYKDDDFNDEPKIDIDNYLDSLQNFQPVRNTVSCNFLPSLNDDFLSEMEKFAVEPVDNIEIIKPSMSLMGFSRDQPQMQRVAAKPAPAPAPIVTTTPTPAPAPAPSSSVFGSLKGKVGSIFHSPLASATTTTSPYIPPSHSSTVTSTPVAAISSIFASTTTTTPPPPATYVTTMTTTFTSSFLTTTTAATKPMTSMLPTVTTAVTTKLPTVPTQAPAAISQIPSFTPQIPTAVTAQLPSVTAPKLPTVQPLVTKLPPVKQKEVYVGECLLIFLFFLKGWFSLGFGLWGVLGLGSCLRLRASISAHFCTLGQSVLYTWHIRNLPRHNSIAPLKIPYWSLGFGLWNGKYWIPHPSLGFLLSGVLGLGSGSRIGLRLLSFRSANSIHSVSQFSTLGTSEIVPDTIQLLLPKFPIRRQSL